MVDSPSSILLLRLQGTGGNTNLWGGYLNTALSTLERAAKGYQALTINGDATISWTNYTATNDAEVRNLKLVAGTVAAAFTLTFPSYQQDLVVWNLSGYTASLKTSGGTAITIPTGKKASVYCDGSQMLFNTPNYTGDTITLANGGDLVNYTALAAALAAIATAGAGLVLNSAADTTAGYLGLKLVEGTGIDLATVNGGGNETLSITVDTVELEEFQALTGKLTGTLSSGTTAMTARRRYRISSTATGTLPTMVAGDFVIVEFTVGAGVVGTVGRNSQTIDGASSDDTYTGDGGSGPVIRYDYVSAGVVTSRLIEGIPV